MYSMCTYLDGDVSIWNLVIVKTCVLSADVSASYVFISDFGTSICPFEDGEY